MRLSVLIIAISGCLFLSNCGKDEIQLPEQDLTGKVDGEAWDLKFSSGFIFSSDLKYRVRFLSTQEGASDPCNVPSTGNTHVSIVIPLQRGSFSLPLPILEESARFHLADGNTILAASGFLEIFDIDNARIFGYLQAQLDDDNSVEGSFEALLCN